VKSVTQLVPVSSDNSVTAEPALLDGKFRVPRGRGRDVVHRDRLTALIEQATRAPGKRLITAPAPGAGKTVACAGWAGRAGQVEADRPGSAWTRRTGDPTRFLVLPWPAALAAGGTTLGASLIPRSREARDDLPGDLVNSVRKLFGLGGARPRRRARGSRTATSCPGLALLIHQGAGRAAPHPVRAIGFPGCTSRRCG